MSKESVRPYKIKQLKFNELSQHRVTDWLLYLANRTQVTKELGIGRNTLYRYLDKIKKETSGIEEIFTFKQLQTLIRLENADWKKYMTQKADLAAKANLDQQEAQLTKTLHQYGWGEITDNLEFAQLIDLQQGSAEQKQQA
ncbi:hypothetical protein GYW21_10115 [Lactobacillus mellis]|nr:hypothetical protein [Bombilactobacillus mellis]NUF99097.1 hypothetical protein [Bombilactobacillus mellis]